MTDAVAPATASQQRHPDRRRPAREAQASLYAGAAEDLSARGAAAGSRAGAGRWSGLTQLVFYGLPWLQWNGRQAVLFDLGARKFYIFGLVL